MPIDVRRKFAEVALAGGGGAFAPAPPPSGALETARALGSARRRRFDALARAVDGETRALAERGAAVAGLGESLGAGGRGLAGSLAALDERRRRGRERHEAATARVRFLRDADSILRRAAEETDPAARDLEPRVRRRLAERSAELLDGLRLGEGGPRAALEEQMAFTAARTALAARRIGARREGAFLRGELDRRLAATHRQALGHRGALQEQLVGIAASDVRDAAAEGLLEAGAAEAKIAAFRTGVMRGTIDADSLSDPAGASARLDSGAYDHLFATGAERAEAARAIARGASTRRAVELARLDGLVDAHAASLRSGGPGRPGLRDTVARLRPEALAAFDERSGRARLFHATAARLRFLPRDEAAALLREAEPGPGPGPGGEDGGDRARLRAALLEAWHARERALRDDPAAYAAGHPAAADRAGNMALQKVLGVREPLELARSEVAAWTRELERAGAGGASGETARVLARFAGASGPTGAAQLSSALAGERPALALAVHHLAAMPDVSADVADGLDVLRGDPARRPDGTAAGERFAAVYGDALNAAPHLRRPVLEAAAALYARAGRERGAPFDAAAFDAALRRIGGAVTDAAGAARGGPFAYRGRTVLPPRPGLGAAETEAALGSLTAGDLETYGNGAPLDPLGRPLAPGDLLARAELVPAGLGRYMLRIDRPEGADAVPEPQAGESPPS